MLSEEVKRYRELSGDNNPNTPISRIGGYLDGYEKAMEQEPCDDVCEWFEQYVDIATDIVELRFSDGTVKRAKRGLYMRDIEKSIRKMLIDQIANEKKQEPKWIPVSERLPDKNGDYFVTLENGVVKILGYSTTQRTSYPKGFYYISGGFSWRQTINPVVAWQPLPQPYKAESEEV